ncbi:hypothetical protein WJX84_007819 [Apatococcus fuscideae]|uniref:DUS-like FMN-binding domain-containing protein n=1 Tax=Apatococcus fuscideae TaxID=2026836 RepID=A0AAW1SXI9_9CHLO
MQPFRLGKAGLLQARAVSVLSGTSGRSRAAYSTERRPSGVSCSRFHSFVLPAQSTARSRLRVFLKASGTDSNPAARVLSASCNASRPWPRPAQSRAAPASRAMHSASSPLHAASMPQRLSVAPMMDWTDVHYRQLARLMSKHTWLYTEMVVDSTIIHNPNTDKFLWFPQEQHPIACQLGGSNPELLAKAARMVAQYGYDEINLNCGCPSDRVAGAGCFGAALMLRPETVAECAAAVNAATPTPLTIKCRLGVDSVDSYESLCNFVRVVSERSGVLHFIIHARKCLLKGLNPHQNRTIPPLRYEAAYNSPWECLSDADRAVFGASSNPAQSRRQVLRDYCKYADNIIGRWAKGPESKGHVSPNVRAVAKPLLGMFMGQRGSRRWKQAMDEAFRRDPATLKQLLDETLCHIPEDILDAPPKTSPAIHTFTLNNPFPEPICSPPQPDRQDSPISASTQAAQASAAASRAQHKPVSVKQVPLLNGQGVATNSEQQAPAYQQQHAGTAFEDQSLQSVNTYLAGN